IGASDLVDEKDAPSKAHLAMDPALEKVMGRPIDFTTLRVRPVRPDAFDIEDYLTIGSVVNTLYAAFSVPKARYPTNRPNLPPAQRAQAARRAGARRATRVTGHGRHAQSAPRIDLSRRLARPISLRWHVHALAAVVLLAYACLSVLSFVQAAALWRQRPAPRA